MSRLTLVVAVYIALDLANPLVPGALAFSVEDSVEAHTIRPIRAEDSPAPSALAPERVEPTAELPARSFVAPSTNGLCRTHVTRSHLSSSALAPTSPDEDSLIQ